MALVGMNCSSSVLTSQLGTGSIHPGHLVVSQRTIMTLSVTKDDLLPGLVEVLCIDGMRRVASGAVKRCEYARWLTLT